jgi:monofunctional biosynthetic peptidoglycan transglycosylase
VPERDDQPRELAGDARHADPASDRGEHESETERRDPEAVTLQRELARTPGDQPGDSEAVTLRREPAPPPVDAAARADTRRGPGDVARDPRGDARALPQPERAGVVAETVASAKPATSAKATATAKPRRWPRRLRLAGETMTLLLALPSLVLLCSVPSTGKLADENPSSTAFIDLRHDQAEAAGKPFKLQWQWKPVGKISRYLRAAVIYAEDINFYTHSGVDWGAIENAFEKDWDRGKLTVGGSTITQQLAKNLYLSPNRSYFRKAREMLIAFSLEDHLPKQRILELYLNVVEWGDGIFGAEAASKHWFGHSAISLSPAEAARLAIALPNPIKRAPNVHTRELTEKAVRIIRLFRMQGLIDAEQERTALDQVGASSEGVLPDRGKAAPTETGKSEPPTKPEAPEKLEPRVKPEPREPHPATEGPRSTPEPPAEPHPQEPEHRREQRAHEGPPSEPGAERPP